MRAEKSGLWKTENIELKKPPILPSVPWIHERPSASPPPIAVASASVAHPCATPNGARVTATTITPDTVSPIDMPGTSAIFSQVP